MKSEREMQKLLVSKAHPPSITVITEVAVVDSEVVAEIVVDVEVTEVVTVIKMIITTKEETEEVIEVVEAVTAVDMAVEDTVTISIKEAEEEVDMTNLTEVDTTNKTEVIEEVTTRIRTTPKGIILMKSCEERSY